MCRIQHSTNWACQDDRHGHTATQNGPRQEWEFRNLVQQFSLLTEIRGNLVQVVSGERLQGIRWAKQARSAPITPGQLSSLILVAPGQDCITDRGLRG